jgi:hypothetical protein
VIRLAQPVDNLIVDIQWRGQSDVVCVPARSKRLTLVDPGVVQRSCEDELKMQAFAANDKVAEIRGRPQ